MHEYTLFKKTTLKRIFSISFLVLDVFFNRIHGQTYKSTLYIEGSTCSLQCYFENFCQTKVNKYWDTACIQSTTFIMFHIIRKGDPTDLQFSFSTPAYIQILVKDCFQTTNRKWKSNDVKLTLYLQFAGSTLN